MCACSCVCVHVEAIGQAWVLLFRTLFPLFFETFCPTDPEIYMIKLGWQASEPHGFSPVSASLVLGVNVGPTLPDFLYDCWGSSSGPHACVETLHQLNYLIISRI